MSSAKTQKNSAYIDGATCVLTDSEGKPVREQPPCGIGVRRETQTFGEAVVLFAVGGSIAEAGREAESRAATALADTWV
ncbi:hypothetical protein [Paraburkholderia sp. HP33-1]|uniref:hypothetical protein n=1 Tax=Paraburkholderia sp. HP33-1 TaxID=2883243 RepID=UPI001F4221AC|nr:hypothetical protein [Paraburkholderia sp. HP33-1]